MKKLVSFIIVLLIVFSLFIVVFYKKNDYSLNYKINNVNIYENYDKNIKSYLINLDYKGKKFAFVSNSKYVNKRKIINDVKIIKEKDLICLDAKSNYISTYPVCMKNNKYVAYDYKNIDKLKHKEDKLFIYDYDNSKFLLWNYHDFVYLDKVKLEKIKLFDKDIYNINLVYQYDNYLIIPDYNKKFKFNKLNIIDVNKLNNKIFELDYELYFDGYFLGNKKDDVYFYDRKEQREYVINFKDDFIKKSPYKILLNDKWTDVTVNELNKGKKFKNDKKFNYKIINNKLYSYINDNDYLTLITDLEVSSIVKEDNMNIYFISKNTLYKYNPYDGLKKLIKYDEWNFNYNNMIYIFK